MGFFFWVLGLTAQGPWRFSNWLSRGGSQPARQVSYGASKIKKSKKQKNKKSKKQKIKKTKKQKKQKNKNSKKQKIKKTKNQENKKTKVLFSSPQIKWSVCHVPLGAPY